MVINLIKLFEFLYENGFRYVAMDTNRGYEISAFVNEPIRLTSGDDVLYAKSKEDFCKPSFGFNLDLNDDNIEDFLIEPGEMEEISKILMILREE